MMHLMRKYEKYVFILTTIVIIISFTFFGAYTTSGQQNVEDPVVFTSFNGVAYTRSGLDEMIRFLATDNEDMLLTGGKWGSNFLNDGVIRKDLIKQGIAFLLLEQNKEDVKQDLSERLSREKNFRPYEHPSAKFISVLNVLNYFSPESLKNFQILQQAKDPVSDEALRARISLLAESRKFSPPIMHQILRFQERQFDWVKPDPELDRMTNLALFGYWYVQDWMGPAFIRFAAEFIINSAEIAQNKGYVVSKDEAWADLARNAQTSFTQLQGSPYLGVATSQQYLEQQLKNMHLDPNGATKIWQQVLLFRRLFHDVSTSVVLDVESIDPIRTYFNQQLTGELYKIAEPFRFKSFTDLQEFEVYLAAATDHKFGDLSVPNTLLPVADANQDLVVKKAVLEVKDVSMKSLQAKVSIKQMWQWQTSDKGWEALKKEFPQLGAKDGVRQEIIDALDVKTRARLDILSREQVVLQHPEWIEQSLDDAPIKKVEMGLREKGGNLPFTGVKNRKELLQKIESGQDIPMFTGDQKNFYRIKVIEVSKNPIILTFEEAKEDGTLSALLKKTLDGKDAQDYFAPILQAIEKDYQKTKKNDEKLIPAIAASMRFYQFARKARANFIKTGEAMTALNEQIHWKSDSFIADRTSGTLPFDASEAFSMRPGEWTHVSTPANGNVNFFKLTSVEVDEASNALPAKMVRLQEVLGSEAAQKLAGILLKQMEKKKG